jgi:adenine phosphoribosyltransferase
MIASLAGSCYPFPGKDLSMDLAQYIRDIPDFPKPGIVFKDITPLLAEPPAFQEAIGRLCREYQGREIDAVAAAEARGFLFAAPMAVLMKLPLIPLRKPGKLPYRTYSLKYELEYGSAELHVHIDGVAGGARVLLVDDLLATGGTMQAGCRLIEKAGGRVAGCAFLVELAFLKGRERLRPHEVFSLIQY